MKPPLDGVRDGFLEVNIALLREYLFFEFNHVHLYDWPDKMDEESKKLLQEVTEETIYPFAPDLDRVINDFIFMATLVGNDFLPALPSLDIAKGVNAKDKIEEAYLIKDFKIQWAQVLPVLQGLTLVEGEGTRTGTHGVTEVEEDPIPDIREAYYRDTLNFTSSTEITQLAKDYLHGVEWVMAYYFQGTPSWGWYFPHHYSPYPRELYTTLAALLKNDPQLDCIAPFTLGRPFTPFQQLAAILPPFSAPCLPEPLQELLSSPTSPISDFYPPLDQIKIVQPPNVPEWHHIVLISFIDEQRLVTAVDSVLKRISPHDLKRNEVRKALLFRNQDDGISITEYSPGPFRLGPLPDAIPPDQELSESELYKILPCLNHSLRRLRVKKRRQERRARRALALEQDEVTTLSDVSSEGD